MWTSKDYTCQLKVGTYLAFNQAYWSTEFIEDQIGNCSLPATRVHDIRITILYNRAFLLNSIVSLVYRFFLFFIYTCTIYMGIGQTMPTRSRTSKLSTLNSGQEFYLLIFYWWQLLRTVVWVRFWRLIHFIWAEYTSFLAVSLVYVYRIFVYHPESLFVHYAISLFMVYSKSLFVDYSKSLQLVVDLLLLFL